MGYAGNEGPQFIIPTAMATGRGGGRSVTINVANKASSSSFDFYIGDEALGAAKSYQLQFPIRHGQIEDWSLMEAYWQHCFFRYLRCNPEEHPVLLTEPPLNAPENREYTAEIMFESFNVPHLYIAVQAVLALAASWMDGRATGKTENPLTGTVIDSGDGVTHIIPVVDGYAIGSAIKHVPLAGREVTQFIQQLLRDRADLSDLINPEETMEIAKRIKEELCYVSPDLPREFGKLDTNEIVKPFKWKDRRSGRDIEWPVGHERFLGPEIFFSPEMSNALLTTPIPRLVDEAIQKCPIDTRRALYSNVVLSGGSTMFKGFDKRLRRDLKMHVDDRLAYTNSLEAVNKSAAPVVNVVAHRNQRYAVWCGGSLFASMEQFPAYCHSRADYEEYGPSICRQSRVFGALLS